MKYLSLLVVFFGLMIGFIPAANTSASVDPGRLVRLADSSTVYYSHMDRRFAFPNERIFRSWFSSFDHVEIISPGTLAGLRLEKSVLYRPGSLIKAATDPRVYLVGFNGQLHWIETEAVAQSLFGNTWASRIEDISDAFLPDYMIMVKETIHSPTDISLDALRNDIRSQTILSNQFLPIIVSAPPTPTTSTTPVVPAPPTTAPASDIIIRSSLPSGVRPNENVRLDAFATGQIPQSVTITINGLLTRSCGAEVVCSYGFVHPTQSSITSYQVVAAATYTDGTRVNKTYTLPVRDSQAGALRLELSAPEGQTPGSVNIRASWNDSLATAGRITLAVDGLEQKTCFSTSICSLSYSIDVPVSSTLAITAWADDTSGQRWITPTSTYKTVTNDHPIVTGGVNAYTVFTGESINVNGQANDGDGVAFIEIWQDDTRVARCESPACSYSTPILTQSGSLSFRIIAQDLRGARTEQIIDPVLILPAIR
ncbi:hypothetical protein KBB27_04010 [Patescibacteria group bacterium]|nr:hypothetical protein [Patescibacteria group bacterium]